VLIVNALYRLRISDQLFYTSGAISIDSPTPTSTPNFKKHPLYMTFVFLLFDLFLNFFIPPSCLFFIFIYYYDSTYFSGSFLWYRFECLPGFFCAHLFLLFFCLPHFWFYIFFIFFSLQFFFFIASWFQFIPCSLFRILLRSVCYSRY
jgi:hypothetical protein